MDGLCQKFMNFFDVTVLQHHLQMTDVLENPFAYFTLSTKINDRSYHALDLGLAGDGSGEVLNDPLEFHLNDLNISDFLLYRRLILDGKRKLPKNLVIVLLEQYVVELLVQIGKVRNLAHEINIAYLIQSHTHIISRLLNDQYANTDSIFDGQK
jgi:hypothetical protein